MGKYIKIDDPAHLAWALAFRAVLEFKAAYVNQRPTFANGGIQVVGPPSSVPVGEEFINGRQCSIFYINEATRFTDEQMADFKKSIEKMGPLTRDTLVAYKAPTPRRSLAGLGVWINEADIEKLKIKMF